MIISIIKSMVAVLAFAFLFNACSHSANEPFNSADDATTSDASTTSDDAMTSDAQGSPDDATEASDDAAGLPDTSQSDATIEPDASDDASSADATSSSDASTDAGVSDGGSSDASAENHCELDGGEYCVVDGFTGICCGSTCCAYYQHCSGESCVDNTCDDGATGKACRVNGVTGYCCDNDCADLYSDPRHCGDCKHACKEGELCVLDSYKQPTCTKPDCASDDGWGACLLPDDAKSVGSCCRGQCKDDSYFYTADADCGGCGRVCPTGTTCQEKDYYGRCTEGTCSDGIHACPKGTLCIYGSGACYEESCSGKIDYFSCAINVPGKAAEIGKCCGQVCVDPGIDSQHCGACDKVCNASEWCLDSKCVPRAACSLANSGDPCPLSSGRPGICCGGACVDTDSDLQNCGECGLVCPNESTMCGTPDCSYGETCNPKNCYYADGTRAECEKTGCPAGFSCYFSKCIRYNCAPTSTEQCLFGPGRLGTCCAGICTDIHTDPANCGKCGKSCGGSICANGDSGPQCFPETGGTSSALPCIEGLSGCPSNEICQDSICLKCSDISGPSACSDSSLACAEGLCVAYSCFGDHSTDFCYYAGDVGLCCFIGCTDIRTDPQNCGDCDWRCAPGQTCENGICVGTPAECGAGNRGKFCAPDKGLNFVCCPTGCVDVLTDPQNCNGCGLACTSGQSCVKGKCQ